MGVEESRLREIANESVNKYTHLNREASVPLSATMWPPLYCKGHLVIPNAVEISTQYSVDRVQ
jgi:hypothetical protein